MSSVQFESHYECCGAVVNMSLDPKISYSELMKKLGAEIGAEPENIELFKCYATKSMMKRPAEFPVGVEADSEKNVESLLEWYKVQDLFIIQCAVGQDLSYSYHGWDSLQMEYTRKSLIM